MSVKTTRVQRLELTHFRGIRHLTLDFTERVTVLVGVNGAGKTSILEALRALFARASWEISSSISIAARQSTRLSQIENSTQPTHLEDNILLERQLQKNIQSINLKNNIQSIYLKDSDIQIGQQSLSLAISAIFEDSSLDWTLNVHSTLPGELTLQDSEEHALSVFADKLSKRIVAEPRTALPLTIYYAIGRSAARDDVPLEDETVQNQLNAYTGALAGSGPYSTSAFVSWFRRREDYENEKRIDNGAYRDAQLQAVRRAVAELLPGFNDLRIRRQPMRMVIRKGNNELQLWHLSDGERYLLTLGADIARRLALANPMAKEPHLCSAIILIDEIETHLHPLWQRRVIPALALAFPNCQFIISTHSPQVLSNVRPESIYLLTQEDGELHAQRPEASFGRDSNRILEDILGVDERPSEIKQMLSDYFYLIDQGKMDEARSLRRDLEALIGPDEPEFTRADAIMRTRELLSR